MTSKEKNKALLDLAIRNGFINPRIDWQLLNAGKVMFLLLSDSHYPIDMGYSILNLDYYETLFANSKHKIKPQQ